MESVLARGRSRRSCSRARTRKSPWTIGWDRVQSELPRFQGRLSRFDLFVSQRPGETRLMAIPSGCLAGLLIVLWVSPASQMPTGPKPEEVTLRGKVMPLNSAIQSLGLDVKPDPETTARQMVLLGDDRSITPILCDDASRALFQDERLRGPQTEIRGRRFPGVPYLQVVNFRIEREGKLQTPEYFCSICSISVRYPQICPCCQGPMELRMKPDRP